MRSKLIIHKEAVINNITAVRRRVKPGVKLMSVVKSNAYGHGLVEFASVIRDRTDWFCVVRLEEGIRLREHGITNPILVLEIPEAGVLNQYLRYKLTATLADITQFDTLIDGIEYHLNFDTGMRRLGLLPNLVSEVLDRMNSVTGSKCTGIYTHYANSDSGKELSVSEQLRVFQSIRSQFPAGLLTHTANSGAIFYHTDKDVQFDAVRPGICLYGYTPGEEKISDLKSVLEWQSYIMQVKHIRRGEPVSYGSTWKAENNGWLGVIPVGYSDGIPRILSGNFEVMTGGRLVKQVGRVTMDYVMVYSEKPLQQGAEVQLFNGKELTPDIWAEKTHTIPYEIVTKLNPDIARNYV